MDESLLIRYVYVLTGIQRTLFPLRSTNYRKSYLYATASMIMAKGKLSVNEFVQCCTFTPGNDASRGP